MRKICLISVWLTYQEFHFHVYWIKYIIESSIGKLFIRELPSFILTGMSYRYFLFLNLDQDEIVVLLGAVVFTNAICALEKKRTIKVAGKHLKIICNIVIFTNFSGIANAVFSDYRYSSFLSNFNKHKNLECPVILKLTFRRRCWLDLIPLA